MRYLVTARVIPGCRAALDRAIDDGTLGAGSIAGDEYLHNMEQARQMPDGRVRWVETCFCAIPLDEERPYWEEYFERLSVQDAHARSKCRHENGAEPWACSTCDCTDRLEERLSQQGERFANSQLPTSNSQAFPTANAQLPNSQLPIPKPQLRKAPASEVPNSHPPR